MDSNSELTTQKGALEMQLTQCIAEKHEVTPENLVSDIAICSARSSFLERQIASYLKEQLKVVKEEVHDERQKRLSCERELAETLKKLNGRGASKNSNHQWGDKSSQTGEGESGDENDKTYVSDQRDESCMLEVPMETNGHSQDNSYLMERSMCKVHDESSVEEKNTMDVGDWK
jgi:hypothetical protein